MSISDNNHTDYPRPNVIYVDVDGTLLINGRANQPVVNWVFDRHHEGNQIIVWSARGAEAARQAVEICGIGDIVSHMLSKPGQVLDDLGNRFTQYMEIIHVNALDRSVQPNESKKAGLVSSLI